MNWPQAGVSASLLLVAITPLLAFRELPDGVAPSDYYGGFYPTEEWLQVLKPIPRDQRRNPFQTVRVVQEHTLEREPWETEGTIWEFTPDELRGLKKNMAPYLELEPAELLGLVPRRNRIAGNARKNFIGRMPCPTKDGGMLNWRPDRPNEITCARDHLLDPFEFFPPTGVYRITGPKGDAQEYPYHVAPDGTETFVNGEFMDPLRTGSLINAAKILGQLYAATGDEEHGKRAAAILYDFARAVPHWPKIHRWRPGVDGLDRFRPVTEHAVYNGIWRDKYHGGMRGGPGALAQAYDLVVNAPVWEELDEHEPGGDARAVIESDLFLYSVRNAVRDDVHFPQPSAALSNYIPSELEGMVLVGRAVGMPELVHYAYWKQRQLAQKTLMADSTFRESPSYGRMHLWHMAKVAPLAKGHTDPTGFVSSIDGTRFDDLDMARDIPELRRALDVLASMVYPDNCYMMMHDTWSKLVSKGHPAPEQTRPLIYPSFGQAVLARGERPKGNQIQAHLHYSGNWGHDHLDMLSFILWPYKEEMIADIGYAHTYRMFANNTSSHNLVAVDRALQQRVLEAGRLLGWHATPGEVQVVEVSAPMVYPQCRTYRRTLFLIPVGEMDNLVLDIFHVEGGSTHEWMAQGSCLADQTLDVSVPTEFSAESYADDGKPFTPPSHRAWEKQLFAEGLKPTDMPYDPWWGVFRDVQKGRQAGPFTATWRAADRELPDVRLHMLEPTDAELYTCTVPSLRRCYSDVLGHEDHALVEKFRTPKVIVRRDGRNLRSRFVALWEPTRGEDIVAEVRSLSRQGSDAVGLEIRTTAEGGDRSIRVFYSPDPAKRHRIGDATELRGRYAAVVSDGGETRVALYDCSYFRDGDLEVRVSPRGPLPVEQVLELAPDEYAVELGGTWGDVPVNDPLKFAEPELVILSQNGGHQRAFPVTAVGTREGKTLLRCSRHPGFEYDRKSRVLREAFTPFLTIKGKAEITLPSRVWLRSDDGGEWEVRGTDDVSIVNSR